MSKQNVFDFSPVTPGEEAFESLLESRTFKLERIVSRAHRMPKGEWYDQAQDEWVVLLKGSAGISVQGESEIRVLGEGDYLHFPAHLRHRVEWTHPDVETVWLAIHYAE